MNAEAILANFAAGVKRGRCAHAYLVNGPVRGGSAEVAQRMVQILLCEGGGAGCGKCTPCKKAAERTHPDLIWMEPKKKSRKISVDDVRDIQSLIYQTSYMGDWKVCVIAAADRMSVQAANALLKSLEEPPSRSMFILLAENPQYLLPTIISRCHRFDLSIATPPEAYEWYEGLAGILSMRGEGTIGQIVLSAGLLSMLKRIKKEIQADEEACCDGEDITDDVLDARISARYREERTAVFRMIILWFRDIMLCVTGDEDNIYHKRYIQHLTAAAKNLSLAHAAGNISVIERICDLLEKNLGEDMVIMEGITRIREAV